LGSVVCLGLPDCRLPGGSNISTGGYLVPPLPRRKELVQLIEECRRALPVEDRADPSYEPKSDLWRLMLANKRKACVKAFDGLVRPSHFNKISRHAWWDGHDYEDVMARWRVGLPPPPKRTASSPNPTMSSSSSKLDTSLRSPPRRLHIREGACPGSVSGCPRRSHHHRRNRSPSPKKPKPVAAARVKIEPGTVKVEHDTVKVEPGIVKLEPTLLEPSEAWRAKYAVPPVYRS
jgi:hypothetical protein